MLMPLPLLVVWSVASFVPGALELIALGRNLFLLWLVPAGLDLSKDQPTTVRIHDALPLAPIPY